MLIKMDHNSSGDIGIPGSWQELSGGSFVVKTAQAFRPHIIDVRAAGPSE
jgi:hypothetical protein